MLLICEGILRNLKIIIGLCRRHTWPILTRDGWTHDYENFQIRRGSSRHRAIRECIVTHRMAIGRFLKLSAAPSRAASKSLTCQKIQEGHTMVQFRVEFASTSWHSQSHREAIFSHRDYIVYLSCGHRHHRLGFATRRQYEGHAMLPDSITKATRHRVAFATPSYKHRI